MTDRRKLLLVLVGMTVVFAGLLWRAEHRTAQVNNRVSRVESPCLKYGPTSKICQHSFETALLTLTHPEACAVERKAGTLRAIRELAALIEASFHEPCKGARLAQERSRGTERDAANPQRTAGSDAANGGDAHQTPSTAHQQPSPPTGGHQGHAPPKGGTHTPSAPENPGGSGDSEPTTAAPTPVTPAEPGASESGSEPPPAPPAGESASKHPVRETVESVTAPVKELPCAALHVCLP